MAEIRPFRAYHYDTKRVALKDVLTQPYDKITPKMQENYYAASPYNLIPVEKGRAFSDDSAENNVYTRASKTIKEWISDKILVQDPAPNIYIYSQEFEIPGTHTRRTRIGFIGLAHVEDYDAKVVFRHEYTLSGPKADRIELLNHTKMQTGQLFFLYDDPARQIDSILEEAMKKGVPDELTDEYGVIHRLWPVSDPAFIAKLQQGMTDKKLVIADGHHRYETALNKRNENRSRLGKTDPIATTEFAMATFINTHSKGLTILATHRVVSRLANFDFDRFRNSLAPYFDWYSYPFQNAEERKSSYEEFQHDLQSKKHGLRAVGVYPKTSASGAFYLFVLKRDADLDALMPGISEQQRQLDVVLLHGPILEKGLGITAEALAGEKNVTYEREMDAAIAAVDRGDGQVAFLLNPAGIQQITDIALGGDVLPQKSTDFYPKLLSGIAIYRIEGSLDKQG